MFEASTAVASDCKLQWVFHGNHADRQIHAWMLLDHVGNRPRLLASTDREEQLI